MSSFWFWIIPFSALTALLFAFFFFKQMMREKEGNETMKKIAHHIRVGSLAYLKQQYKIVSAIFVIIALIFSFLAFGLNVQSPWLPLTLISGGFFSGLAGYLGMRTATYASARTANAAMESLDRGLKVAFRSGAVMGLVVVGLGLLNVSGWFAILSYFVETSLPSQKLIMVTTTMLTFGMGASLQALFARVGGGIFTKAADVGADLVGKVEAGIPEDDPRNPATIADNVGDNVGDVAGMGADLYESYCGSILATAALGAATFAGSQFSADLQLKAVLAPMVIGAVGTLLSIFGIFLVRAKSDASSKDLLKALNTGIYASAGLIVVVSLFILHLLELPNATGIWGSVVIGLLTGIAIGKATEYYTSPLYSPTRRVAEQASKGPANVIISGLGEGMISSSFPVLAIVVGTFLAYAFASSDFGFGSKSMTMGLYGIGMAAVGMLSTLGITLATDAYGPIADNAGGNAEMSGLDPEVRRRTDTLDSLGNTTAAMGKGFAIGSAALTALALLASYIEALKMGMQNINMNSILINEISIPTHALTLENLMVYYQVHLLNPKVLLGIFIGAMMAFLFCGLTMNAVGRSASKMIVEVRRQFREIKGIFEGTTEPDYAECVKITTLSAQKEMLAPALFAVIAPVAVGIIFGVAGVLGLLTGALAGGFTLAVFMANSGGAWDNAKKFIEEGNFGGKGSESHKSAVIGDTVGDPFKDTSGPSLNILIKLMTMVAIVMSGVTVSFSLF
ncbi:MAG: sodium-translocating pyrophosphatase [SAR324 cluster bacterium]|nr:sodium-translocating pyrophosphatase [SAR324 cluster bacterium]